MAKTTTMIFPPDPSRDEIAVIVRAGTVTVQVCTVAMAGGVVPTNASPWVVVPGADAMTASNVIYRGRDAYVRVVPAASSSYEVA